MSDQDFRILCAIEDTLIALGMTETLDALRDGDEQAAEVALNALLEDEDQ